MYNLLVGFTNNTIDADRVFEYTEQALLDYVRPSGVLDPGRLYGVPALLMPEVSGTSPPSIARVGRITGLKQNNDRYRFTFHPNTTFPALRTDQIVDLAGALEISHRELRRTHWAIKDVDLYGVLLEATNLQQLAPQVFSFPIEVPVESDLVAVMMPFDAEFDTVYAAIKDAVHGLGLRCHRADDIWDNHRIMDDIIGLIWRSRLIVSDLTSKNANVFYETGIAHSLGRDVIPIAQSMDDVPFDLRAIRALTYARDEQGLEYLKTGLTSRIAKLTF